MAGMNGDDNSRGGFAGTLVPPFLSVCAVTAILVGLFVWLGPDDPATSVLSQRDSTPTSHAPSPTATPPASSPPPSSPPASSAPASSPAPTTSGPEQSPTATRGEVVVLNQSGGTGLAARVAQLVRDKGWDVDTVGSFRGTVSTTTVYYPSDQQDKARALAKDLPGDPRVMERFSNLSTTRLTIVLTDDYGE
jgi:pyruvate/2-oxoglutarate dehydrogenase complex dihydrolipoamide acyltransferase (E2) component